MCFSVCECAYCIEERKRTTWNLSYYSEYKEDERERESEEWGSWRGEEEEDGEGGGGGELRVLLYDDRKLVCPRRASTAATGIVCSGHDSSSSIDPF